MATLDPAEQPEDEGYSSSYYGSLNVGKRFGEGTRQPFSYFMAFYHKSLRKSLLQDEPRGMLFFTQALYVHFCPDKTSSVHAWAKDWVRKHADILYVQDAAGEKLGKHLDETVALFNTDFLNDVVGDVLSARLTDAIFKGKKWEHDVTFENNLSNFREAFLSTGEDISPRDLLAIFRSYMQSMHEVAGSTIVSSFVSNSEPRVKRALTQAGTMTVARSSDESFARELPELEAEFKLEREKFLRIPEKHREDAMAEGAFPFKEATRIGFLMSHLVKEFVQHAKYSISTDPELMKEIFRPAGVKVKLPPKTTKKPTPAQDQPGLAPRLRAYMAVADFLRLCNCTRDGCRRGGWSYGTCKGLHDHFTEAEIGQLSTTRDAVTNRTLFQLLMEARAQALARPTLDVTPLRQQAAVFTGIGSGQQEAAWNGRGGFKGGPPQYHTGKGGKGQTQAWESQRGFKGGYGQQSWSQRGGKGFQLPDWYCDLCGVSNFASRSFCRDCGPYGEAIDQRREAQEEEYELQKAALTPVEFPPPPELYGKGGKVGGKGQQSTVAFADASQAEEEARKSAQALAAWVVSDAEPLVFNFMALKGATGEADSGAREEDDYEAEEQYDDGCEDYHEAQEQYDDGCQQEEEECDSGVQLETGPPQSNLSFEALQFTSSASVAAHEASPDGLDRDSESGAMAPSVQVPPIPSMQGFARDRLEQLARDEARDEKGHEAHVESTLDSFGQPSVPVTAAVPLTAVQLASVFKTLQGPGHHAHWEAPPIPVDAFAKEVALLHQSYEGKSQLLSREADAVTGMLVLFQMLINGILVNMFVKMVLADSGASICMLSKALALSMVKQGGLVGFPAQAAAPISGVHGSKGVQYFGEGLLIFFPSTTQRTAVKVHVFLLESNTHVEAILSLQVLKALNAVIDTGANKIRVTSAAGNHCFIKFSSVDALTSQSARGTVGFASPQLNMGAAYYVGPPVRLEEQRGQGHLRAAHQQPVMERNHEHEFADTMDDLEVDTGLDRESQFWRAKAILYRRTTRDLARYQRYRLRLKEMLDGQTTEGTSADDLFLLETDRTRQLAHMRVVKDQLYHCMSLHDDLRRLRFHMLSLERFSNFTPARVFREIEDHGTAVIRESGSAKVEQSLLYSAIIQAYSCREDLDLSVGQLTTEEGDLEDGYQHWVVQNYHDMEGEAEADMTLLREWFSPIHQNSSADVVVAAAPDAETVNEHNETESPGLEEQAPSDELPEGLDPNEVGQARPHA